MDKRQGRQLRWGLSHQFGEVVVGWRGPDVRGQRGDISKGLFALIAAHRAIAFFDPPANQALAGIVGATEATAGLIQGKRVP